MYGLPQPAPLKGRDDIPPIYLPSFKHKKFIHEQYVQAAVAGTIRASKITLFLSIWLQCCSHIKVTKPRTDVCQRCEEGRREVQAASTEQEKLDSLSKFTNHIQHGQEEREGYIKNCQDAKNDLAPLL